MTLASRVTEAEDQLSLLKCELKTIENNVEKLHSELSWNHNELANQNAKITNLNDKLDLVTVVFVVSLEKANHHLQRKWWFAFSRFGGSDGNNGSDLKSEMKVESNISIFKSEVRISQEFHFFLLQREIKMLQDDIEKMLSDQSRIRDELLNQSAETSNLTNRLHRDFYALAAKFENAKYTVISLVYIFAVGAIVLPII